MTLTIGMVSGFLVAGLSMKTAYDKSFSKYNIEDGHFITMEKISDSIKEEIEKEKISVFEDFYKV